MSSIEVQRLQSKSVDDLYEELGRTLMISEYPGRAITRLLAVEKGKSFISGSLDKIKGKICVDWKYCSKRGAFGNFQSLVYAISPLVASVVGVPASTALIVSVLLVKMGLDDLCKCSSA